MLHQQHPFINESLRRRDYIITCMSVITGIFMKVRILRILAQIKFHKDMIVLALFQLENGRKSNFFLGGVQLLKLIAFHKSKISCCIRPAGQLTEAVYTALQ